MGKPEILKTALYVYGNSIIASKYHSIIVSYDSSIIPILVAPSRHRVARRSIATSQNSLLYRDIAKIVAPSQHRSIATSQNSSLHRDNRENCRSIATSFHCNIAKFVAPSRQSQNSSLHRDIAKFIVPQRHRKVRCYIATSRNSSRHRDIAPLLHREIRRFIATSRNSNAQSL
jgi:hypothetical protein